MINDDTSTDTISAETSAGCGSTVQSSPGLLIPYVPDGTLVSVDRCKIESPFLVGRAAVCDLQIRDNTISKRHLRFSMESGRVFMEDLDSRNGTEVNGEPIGERVVLDIPSVIRIGDSILIYHNNVRPLLAAPLDQYGIVGSFHVGEMLEEIKSASLSSRNVLFAGPSGSGKELAARAFVKMSARKDRTFITHNAARFSSEEEATTTLFGVAKGTFSDVRQRSGVIEEADGGILFLDETHRLPKRVQDSLLRVIEDKRFSRIGETGTRDVDVIFIFASNDDGPTFSLPHDLLARLRVVNIPPLSERRADIPKLFNHHLGLCLKRLDIAERPVFEQLNCNRYELLCLDAFKETNVRGIIDLADRIATGIKAGGDPHEAIYYNFNERFKRDPFADKPSRNAQPHAGTGKFSDKSYAGSTEAAGGDLTSRSYYEEHRTVISEVYIECKGNVSATVRKLEKKGVRANRNSLSHYVLKWELPHKNEIEQSHMT